MSKSGDPDSGGPRRRDGMAARGNGVGDSVVLGAGSEWATAIDGLPHDAYHLPGYVSLEAARMGGVATLFVYQEGRNRLVLPLVVRPIPGKDRVDACSPYGYPGPVATPGASHGFWSRSVSALRHELTSSGVVSAFVRLHPLLPADNEALGESGPVLQHGHTVTIDLGMPEADAAAQLRSNHRRQILRARRDGLAVRFDEWHRLDEFVEMYHETMRRVGATDFYFFDAQYFRALRDHLGDAVHLVLVQDDQGRSIGGGVIFEASRIIQYHLGATRTAHLPRQPTKLMFDEIRLWGRDRGARWFHLGGGVGGEGNSLFHFKTGFSRDTRPFYTWRCVIDRREYEHLTGSRAPAPSLARDDDDEFFPAYRRAPVSS